MKTKTKLSLFFSFITATILLIFASVIYLSAKQSREREFYHSLKREALTKANLLFNAKVDSQTLQNIYRSNREFLNEVEVAIYTPSFELLYHDAVDIDVVKETPQMIDDIFQKKELKFYVEDWQGIGFSYEYNNQDYIITAAAFDLYGYNKLHNLFLTITVGFIISILIIFIAGRFFSKKAFKPISEMNEKVKVITATNLDLRLENDHNKDELSELAHTFNHMLDRLEKSFNSQKDFVSNVAHELRTPLSAMIAELDLTTNKERKNEEYKTAIKNTLNDARKLARLSNSLLDFAKASYDPSEIAFRQVRIDEILLDARHQVTRMNQSYTIDIHFESYFYKDENEEKMIVTGNEYLLWVAFVNLFENGCKFSTNKKSKVLIALKENKISLNFSDQGIGISNKDLEKIFIPFYRGSNKTFSDGNGIGLSLTKRIIQLHQGSIKVSSSKNSETVFNVLLPYIT